ncbi:MAG TPA: hypothetical protein VHA75_12565 [Rugosimonospora sp.]|nr:hypothetical protein [Rugosimonospora sp.]
MISVLMPSRGRPASLVKSAMSVFDHAARPDAVEVLVAADPDDMGTHAVAEDLGLDCWVAPERYGYGGIRLYFNRLAEVAIGDWMLLWNDDATMITKGWDVKVEALPPSAMVADLRNAFSPGLCCFPAVRRAAVELLDGYCSANTPHVDSWWQEIGRRSGTIQPVDAFVHHDRFDLTGGHDDATYREGRTALRNAEFFGSIIQTQINEAAARLRDLVAS